MPVRNISDIGPSGNIKPIPIFHAIPPASAAIMKVTVSTQNDGEIDITSLISSATINIGVISPADTNVGDIDLSFIDAAKTNYNKINLFDDIYFYADYGTSATTKRFRFKIEDKGFSNFNTNLSGRGIGMIIATKNIIYQSTNSSGALVSKNRSDILISILQDNFPDITDFTHIETDTTQVQKSYFETPAATVIQDLCGSDKYFYLDKDFVPYYFTIGSKLNSTEGISDQNLIDVKDNSTNGENVYTRVRVYGKNVSGLPILATSNIGTTNTNGINKDYVINNQSITSQAQAQSIADAQANYLENYKSIGNIESFLLPSLQAGDSLFIGLPDYNIPPANYNIQQFTININNESGYAFKTSFTIEQKRISTPSILQTLNQNQTNQADNYNPYDMNYSETITFSSVSGTANGTTVDTNQQVLRVSDGQTSGIWTSDPISIGTTSTEGRFGIVGGNLSSVYTTYNTVYKYSIDDGNNFIVFNLGDLLDLTGNSGSIIFEIDLNQSTAYLNAIGIFWK